MSFPLPSPGIAGQPYQFATIPSNGTDPSKLFIKNTTAAYVYDGTAVTQVTSPNYPALTVWGVAYLDGRIYVCAPDGTIYGSDTFDPLTWNPLTFIAAKSTGDNAVALVRHLVYILIFKQRSTEFFYDAGLPAPGAPIAVMPNAFMEVGCAVAGSISFNDNTVYFMSESTPKGRSIARMDGFEHKRISTIYIDRLLNSSDLSAVYSFTIKKNGHEFYVLTLVDIELTLVYDDVTKEWHRWTCLEVGESIDVTTETDSDGLTVATLEVATGIEDGDPVSITYETGDEDDPTEITETVLTTYITNSSFSFVTSGPILGNVAMVTPWVETYFPGIFYTRGTNEDFILAQSGAFVYEFAEGTYQDDGQPVNTKARTAIDDWQVMRLKRFNRLELVGDIVNTTVLVRFNDDDYQGTRWSQYRPIIVTDDRAQLAALGSARRRAHEFRHTGNTALRMEALELDFDVGAR